MNKQSIVTKLIIVALILSIVLSLVGTKMPFVQAQTQSAPILLVVNDSSPSKFGRYLGEILLAEGLNSFDIVTLSNLTATTLNQHDLTILAQTPLSPAQASLFTNYVNGGGRLLAMRPDSQIKGLFGLGASQGSLNTGYLQIDTTVTLNGVQPGQGLTSATLQIHGATDEYSPANGAVTLVKLYSNASTATPYPAVLSNSTGQAIAFNYDLAQNIAYTRQGNPANANVDVDADTVFRTIDLFESSGSGSPWVDRDKISVPQADVQQRFFARIVRKMVADVRPLPQLWYFPDTAKTMLILTGDAHANPTSYYQMRLTVSVRMEGKLPSTCLSLRTLTTLQYKRGAARAIRLEFIPTHIGQTTIRLTMSPTYNRGMTHLIFGFRLNLLALPRRPYVTTKWRGWDGRTQPALLRRTVLPWIPVSIIGVLGLRSPTAHGRMVILQAAASP